MWKINVPPKLHVFLWLLANEKVLTRDNLAKRRQVDDLTCLYCNDTESVKHVFFECCVAKWLWEVLAEVTGLPVIIDFENMELGG
jgi:5-methylcytosine-specific restriction endonuclease McrA